MKKYLVPAIFTLLIIGIVIFVVRAASSNSNDAKPAESSTTSTALTDEQKARLKEGQKKGASDAKVVVTEFADFQCPACKVFAPTLDEILKENEGKVLIVFKHFPLYPQPHQNALVSAYASEAAAKQGKFWEMYTILYEKQDDWAELEDPKPKFVEYAKSLGLNEDGFRRDLDAEAGKDVINADKDFASELKLKGTPSIFVNGEEYSLRDGGAAGLKARVKELVAQEYGQSTPQ